MDGGKYVCWGMSDEESCVRVTWTPKVRMEGNE
jgi:hypothetical protein